MQMVKPFIYDRRDRYFQADRNAEIKADRLMQKRLAAMRAPLDPDDYELLPFSEGHREIYHRYNLWNYDDPFYQSHGKRGRK